MYHLTRHRLLIDLYAAYYEARRHKRWRGYQLRFEAELDDNLLQLCDELWERRYRPRPSVCFIVHDPKQREVFAADFRDRVVHHLYYGYVHAMLERTFIADSYSCIRHRGTHYGISRLEQHIRQESHNYTQTCHVLKLDIRGYFMHIPRERLCTIAMQQIRHMAGHHIHRGSPERWSDRLDIDFVLYLTREIVMLDPTLGCRHRGPDSDWEGLPASKSLFHSPEGCGLPIGNLTSQLFSNVYLNHFDQFVKRCLRCRHYGRYVDDAFVVSADRRWLLSLLPSIRRFLRDELGLTLHEGKLQVADVRRGVEFVGSYLRPWRRLPAHGMLGRMCRKLQALRRDTFQALVRGVSSRWLDVGCFAPMHVPVVRSHLMASVGSFAGILSHTS